MYHIAEISYEDIQVFWNKLWPGRSYEAHSAMSYLGGYLAWPPKEVYYYGVFTDQNDIVGVNSCHDTGHMLVRSRGLWVDPQHRGHQLGVQLLDHATQWAEQRDYYAVWSYPRRDSWATYKAAGYEQEGPWFTDSNAVTNCYAIRRIK